MREANGLSEAEETAFCIMAGRTRHGRQKSQHVRTLTIDTVTAEYFDLIGPRKEATARMAAIVTAHAHHRYDIDRRARGLNPEFTGDNNACGKA